jgi:Tripartite tricarboxylate transporter family receptor
MEEANCETSTPTISASGGERCRIPCDIADRKSTSLSDAAHHDRGAFPAEPMHVALGQAIIVENRTGAAGTIGTGSVARAAPNGYTLMVGYLGTHVLNGALYELSYDVLRDFEPIALLASNPQLIVAKRAMPAKNLRELVGWLKANPDKASQGTAGAGSPAHVVGAFFQSVTNTRFAFIPYRGAAPAMQDLIGGQVDLMFDQASNSLSHVRDGKIKAYAVTSNTRLVAAPEIPTVDEAGAGILRFCLDRNVGAQRHVQRCNQQAQCRGRARLGGPPRAATVCRPWSRDHAARPTASGSSARLPKGGGRQMVPDHQGGRHQGRVTPARSGAARLRIRDFELMIPLKGYGGAPIEKIITSNQNARKVTMGDRFSTSVVTVAVTAAVVGTAISGLATPTSAQVALTTPWGEPDFKESGRKNLTRPYSGPLGTQTRNSSPKRSSKN